MNLASRHWLSAILLALLAFLLWSAFAGMTSEEVKAFKGYKRHAEKRDPVAQYNLGVCYDKGLGVAKDEVEAVKWWRKSANQGYAKAQFNLGNSYDNGTGVAKDENEAFKWFIKAVDQGHAKVQSNQFNLGLSCFTGVAKDEVEAAKWWRKAADQGYAKAQYVLGYCYSNGEGVAQDDIEAYAYWNLAGITHEVARKNVTILEKRMSADQIAAGQKRAKVMQKEIEAKIAAKQAGK